MLLIHYLLEYFYVFKSFFCNITVFLVKYCFIVGFDSMYKIFVKYHMNLNYKLTFGLSI